MVRTSWGKMVESDEPSSSFSKSFYTFTISHYSLTNHFLLTAPTDLSVKPAIKKLDSQMRAWLNNDSKQVGKTLVPLLLQMPPAAWSVCLCVGDTDVPWQNGWAHQDAIWRSWLMWTQENHVFRWKSRSPQDGTIFGFVLPLKSIGC